MGEFTGVGRELNTARDEREMSDIYSKADVERLTEPLGTRERANQRRDLASSEAERLSSELADAAVYPALDDVHAEVADADSLDEALAEWILDQYRQLLGTRLVNNRSIAELLGGLAYLNCRKRRVPRTLAEVGSASVYDLLSADERETHVRHTGPTDPTKIVSASYETVADELGVTLTPLDPECFVRRYCRELDFTESVTEVALVTCRQVEDAAYSGVASHSFAAGVVLYAVERCDVNMTQRQIALNLPVWTDTMRTQRDNVRRALES